MSPGGPLSRLREISSSFAHQPGLSLRLLSQLSKIMRGSTFGAGYSQGLDSAAAGDAHPLSPQAETPAALPNPLKAFFDSRETGRGIWKWTHYFDIYHRHFSKFVGRDVHVLEIGVHSGGSLEMWRDYFGPNCRLYGVDIEEACKSYANEQTEIFIGDQEDRNFWRDFKGRVPVLDVLIDDGGHKTGQQIVTIEEMLPHLRPGGVYLCEDVHREYKGFSAYMQGLVSNLNAKRRSTTGPGFAPTEFQAWISSVHLYPYVAVIEKAERPLQQLNAPKHGTDWQQFA